MARLKGGKLLLDLTSYGDIVNTDINHPLTNEQIQTILSKSVVLQIIVSGIVLVFEPLIKEISSTAITYYGLNSGEKSWGVALNLEDKEFVINEL